MKGGLMPSSRIRQSDRRELTLPAIGEPGLMFRERPLNLNTPD
jgi:hypothetical protein